MLNTQQIATKIGSFWLDNMTPDSRKQAMALAATTVETSNFEYSKILGAYAINISEMSTGSFALRYSPKSVVHITPDDDIFVLPGYVINGGVCDRNSFKLGANDEAWVIPVDAKLVVDALITQNGRTWVSGVDFTGVLGAVVLFENPAINFSKGVLPVKAGRLQVPGLLRGLHDLKRTPAGCGRFVEYYRAGNRTAANMVRAAAEYAGYLVFQDACKIIGVEREGPGYRYITTSGVYFAAYGHTPEVVGTYVDAGHIAGLDYEVFTKEDYDQTQNVLQNEPPDAAQLLQHLTGTPDGKIITDSVNIFTPPEICDIPCIVFDDVGDKAVFSLAGIPDAIQDFDIRLTFEAGQADEVVFFELGVYEEMSNFIKLEVDAYIILFTVYVESEDWFRISIDKTIVPNLFDNLVSVRFVRTNSVLSVYLNDDLLEEDDYTTDGYTDTVLACSPKQGTFNPHPNASWACKYFYMNLDGYEAEFNFEEGAGNILYNTKDSSANAHITSTSGVAAMRATRVNGVTCHNAKNGCSKVSGSYFYWVPDGEFVYIPADENEIAADPTMVPSIHITDDMENLDEEFTLRPIWASHANFLETVSGLYSVEFLDAENQWVFNDENIGYFYFPTGVNVANEYPPKGTFLVSNGGGTRTITIAYDHPYIDDDGKIITPNLNCMPGTIHNGAGYKVIQTEPASSFPSPSPWFNGNTPLKLTRSAITEASLHGDFIARTLQLGVNGYCHVTATGQYPQNTLGGMSEEDLKAVHCFMGARACNPEAREVFNWWDALTVEIPDTHTLDMFCSKKGIRAHTNNTATLQWDLYSKYVVTGIPSALSELNNLVRLYEVTHTTTPSLYDKVRGKTYVSSFDMFFEYVLGECAVIVKLKTGNTTLNNWMVDFFKEERPATKFVITIGNVGE